MKYDFDTPVDRRNTDSIKWAVEKDELPMWVADMDFPAAPPILDALEKKIRQGVFGYCDVTGDWYNAYISWWAERHGLAMKREELTFCTGVVAAISSIVRKLTTPNENVLIFTPVYNIFFNSIVNNGCRVLECPLVYDGEKYEIDFADLDRKLADPQTTLMIFCNPHNPVGKIWPGGDMMKIGQLAKRHHVTVISDEIHCDITVPGKGYIPFAAVSDICRDVSVSLMAPTKAFNLAGLHTSAVYVHDKTLRHKVRRGLNTDEVAEPNSFAVAAAVAAFGESGEWLDEMREYVFANRRYAEEYIDREIPGMKAVRGEATYLMWVDASELLSRGKLSDGDADLAAFVRRTTGLFVSNGGVYGKEGKNFLRINLACPRSTVEDGMSRLKRAAEAFAR
ncbi:MAG: pyridoxal phosphate-dependent aminotransferase [Clostridia bacterium]|nr:pyridoxal phosphate-dependent aminotransferase [Clostridia bacterium]